MIRTTKKLILENENCIFPENLTVTEELVIRNTSLIVSRKLRIDPNCKVCIVNSDISAGSITSYVDINIEGKGDIFSKGKLIAFNLSTNGSISAGCAKVGGDVSCKSYSIRGNNNSLCIYAEDTVEIFGKNNSLEINASKVFFGADSDLNDSNLVTQELEYEGKLLNAITYM